MSVGQGLKHFFNPDTPESKGRALLRALCKEPGKDLKGENEREILCRKLIAEGADVSLKDKYLDTTVIMAAYSGFDETLERILSKNCVDVNAQNESGNTAAHLAAGYKHLYCFNILMRAGADVTIKGQFGQTVEDVVNSSICSDEIRDAFKSWMERRAWEKNNPPQPERPPAPAIMETAPLPAIKKKPFNPRG